MTDPWNRIEAWLAVNAPRLHARLAPGATEAQLSAAEADLGFRLPDELRASLRRHDGSLRYDGSTYWELSPLADIIDTWHFEMSLYLDGEFREADDVVRASGPVRPVWWHPQWVPFTDDASGDHLCIDLAPAEGGTVGQIVTFWHADERREVLAPSLTAYLGQIADAMEAGDIRLGDDGYLTTEPSTT